MNKKDIIFKLRDRNGKEWFIEGENKGFDDEALICHLAFFLFSCICENNLEIMEEGESMDDAIFRIIADMMLQYYDYINKNCDDNEDENTTLDFSA